MVPKEFNLCQRMKAYSPLLCRYKLCECAWKNRRDEEGDGDQKEVREMREMRETKGRLGDERKEGEEGDKAGK